MGYYCSRHFVGYWLSSLFEVMGNNYNKVAPVYDLLSRLVFGKAQVELQLDMLAYIPATSRILIVGGGTGWILEALAARYPDGLDITYLEISEKMLELSQKRDCGKNTVRFVHQAIETYDLAYDRYDVIFTPFLFDNFQEKKAATVFGKLDDALQPSGYWLYADFYLDPQRKEKWKKAMLALMYAFFSIVSNVETRHLPHMEPTFARLNYQECYHSLRYFGFLKGVVYRKNQAV
ncbi:Methyltransferase domain-containing protein [bacterium A37T11]|nr:Methyltransferase domain-containing protein [bacterium A37T11]